MAFRVGQKVVCVNDDVDDGHYGPHDITRGHKYIVRWIGPYSDDDYPTPELCVRLVGVERSMPLDREVDLPFRATRFRPLIERSTEAGMTILKKVADDASKRRELTVCGNE